jgi:ATP-dependent protease ClpP protease subunit
MSNNRHNDILHDFHDYSTNIKSREIFLHNYYPDNEGNQGVEYKMANVFIKNLRALNLSSNKQILVHLYSIGGEWNDCMAMYDAIQFSESPITMLSYGQTESSSTILLQAASRRILMPNSYFMVHYGNSGYSGEYQNVQNWNKYENYICDIMMTIYAERCVKGQFFKEKKYTVDQIKKYLYKKFKDGDWYMSPEEAVYYGFADGVLGDIKENISTIITS